LKEEDIIFPNEEEGKEGELEPLSSRKQGIMIEKKVIPSMISRVQSMFSKVCANKLF
jgi:hypothetical protein